MKKAEALYFKVKSPEGKVHIHIDYTGNKIENIFVRIPPIGTPINVLAASLGVILSKYFQLGGTIDAIIKHLNSAKGSSRVIEDEGENVESIPNAIALALIKFKEYLATKEKHDTERK